MNRVLALQGLSKSSMGTAGWDSNQSIQCSSATTHCSTQSAGCDATVNLMAW